MRKTLGVKRRHFTISPTSNPRTSHSQPPFSNSISINDELNIRNGNNPVKPSDSPSIGSLYSLAISEMSALQHISSTVASVQADASTQYVNQVVITIEGEVKEAQNQVKEHIRDLKRKFDQEELHERERENPINSSRKRGRPPKFSYPRNNKSKTITGNSQHSTSSNLNGHTQVKKKKVGGAQKEELPRTPPFSSLSSLSPFRISSPILSTPLSRPTPTRSLRESTIVDSKARISSVQQQLRKKEELALQRQSEEDAERERHRLLEVRRQKRRESKEMKELEHKRIADEIRLKQLAEKKTRAQKEKEEERIQEEKEEEKMKMAKSIAVPAKITGKKERSRSSSPKSAGQIKGKMGDKRELITLPSSDSNSISSSNSDLLSINRNKRSKSNSQGDSLMRKNSGVSKAGSTSKRPDIGENGERPVGKDDVESRQSKAEFPYASQNQRSANGLFECPYPNCSRAFKHRSNWWTHKKKVHGAPRQRQTRKKEEKDENQSNKENWPKQKKVEREGKNGDIQPGKQKRRKKRTILADEDGEDFDDDFTLFSAKQQTTERTFTANRSLRRSKPVNYKPQLEENPHSFIELTWYESESVQPFKVQIDRNVNVLLDIHAHLTDTEVIGMLAGEYRVTDKTLIIKAAFPCKTQDTNDNRFNVEMDYASQAEAGEKICAAGMKVVGWYHSHPYFRNLPSLIDFENQEKYQAMFMESKHSEDSFCPFVGAIITPYGSREFRPLPSDIKWFFNADQTSVKKNLNSIAADLRQLPMELWTNIVETDANLKSLSDQKAAGAERVDKVIALGLELCSEYAGAKDRVDFTAQWLPAADVGEEEKEEEKEKESDGKEKKQSVRRGKAPTSPSSARAIGTAAAQADRPTPLSPSAQSSTLPANGSSIPFPPASIRNKLTAFHYSLYHHLPSFLSHQEKEERVNKILQAVGKWNSKNKQKEKKKEEEQKEEEGNDDTNGEEDESDENDEYDEEEKEGVEEENPSRNRSSCKKESAFPKAEKSSSGDEVVVAETDDEG